jgi:hypothetical protein
MHPPVTEPEKVRVSTFVLVATSEVMYADAPALPKLLPDESRQVTHGNAVPRL